MRFDPFMDLMLCGGDFGNAAAYVQMVVCELAHHWYRAVANGSRLRNPGRERRERAISAANFACGLYIIAKKAQFGTRTPCDTGAI